MKKILITISLILFLFPPNAFSAFSDVPADHQYLSDITYVENLGLAEGDNFEPNAKISREVFAEWVLKNSGFSDENYSARTRKRFQDVPREGPYTPYIYKLADLGILDMDAGRFFNPSDPVTRKDALAWMLSLEGIPIPKIFDQAQFQARDVNINSQIAPIINKAIQIGLISPGRAQPNRKITRAEAAHLLKSVKHASQNVTITIVPAIEPDIMRSQRFSLMSEVWNRIFETYLERGNLDRDQLIYGALEGMAKELNDPHTEFDRPGLNTIVDSLSGEIEGIGAVLQIQNEEVFVVAPIVGSPAERAGLLGGDVITAVDDVPTRGLPLNEVVAKIKGRRGTRVKLSIRRQSAVLTLNITREVVRIVSASGRRTSDNISIVTLTNFGDNSLSEFQEIINGYQTNMPGGVVLDLRNNPGGYLSTSVEIAGYFILNNNKVVTVKYADHQEDLVSPGPNSLSRYRMVILVNSGTASASEILAGALQDYGLATIVGEKTYGKGTVQELSNFTDGSSLKLTVAEWLTPNGRRIDGNGITPDVEVPMTNEDRQAGNDPQLERALAILRD